MAGRGRSPAQGQSYESYVPSAASCTSDGPLRRLGGAPGRSLSDSSRVPRYDSQERRNDICRPLRVLDSHVWCALCLGGGKPRCSTSRSLRRSAGWKPRSADKSSQRRPTSIHALALVDHAFCEPFGHVFHSFFRPFVVSRLGFSGLAHEFRWRVRA